MSKNTKQTIKKSILGFVSGCIFALLFAGAFAVGNKYAPMSIVTALVPVAHAASR